MQYAEISDYRRLFPNADWSDHEIESALEQSSTDVDSLTFNRIVQAGFENLTNFQKDRIVQAVCLQANFRMENRDVLTSPLTSYSINGVSMSFESKNIEQYGDVQTEKTVLAALRQTGLMCRRLL